MSPSRQQHVRRQRLAARGANSSVVEELLAYNESLFARERGAVNADALPDEPHLSAWEGYLDEARSSTVIGALARRFPQLLFPIRKGISGTEAYRRATRQGIWPDEESEANGLPLRRPDRIELSIHPTIAGRVPLIVAEDRTDFENLVRAFSARNEPIEIPASMGACIVTGFNNWDRIHAYRRVWEVSHPFGDWQAEFAALVQRKELYEDRFILLSGGPYSGVPADQAGFEPSEWLELSGRIRRDHECTHYFTFRLAGRMRNNLLDELIADYVGLVRTFGSYRTDLALRFLGLEDFPAYREGARLQNYRGHPPLSDSAFELVRRLLYESVSNLGGLDAALGPEMREGRGLARLVIGLASMTLDDLAAGNLRERVLGDARERPASSGLKPKPSRRRATGRSRHVSLNIPRAQRGIDRVVELFSLFAANQELSRRFCADVCVVLDEVLSNIVKYGKACPGRQDVQIGWTLEPGRLEIVVNDAGEEFNMLAAPDPEVDLPLEEKPIGGLGVYLVKKLTAEQRYERRRGRNRLVLVLRV